MVEGLHQVTYLLLMPTGELLLFKLLMGLQGGVCVELGHDDDDEEEDSDEDSMGEDTVSKDLLNSTQTPPCSPIKSLNNSSSPVGINRR